MTPPRPQPCRNTDTTVIIRRPTGHTFRQMSTVRSPIELGSDDPTPLVAHPHLSHAYTRGLT